MFDFLRSLTRSEHQRVDGMLSAYIDGELSASEVELVERHLKECAACARNLETLRATVKLVRQLPRVPAPRSFTITPAVQPLRFLTNGLAYKAYCRLSHWCETIRHQPQWGYAYLRGATALVAFLLVIALSVDILSQRFPLIGAPADLAIAPSPALEMKAALREPATEGALEAVPSPGLSAEATPTLQAMALPAPKPTPEATPEALPQEVSTAIPQPAGPWLQRLRQIEFTLLLGFIALTAITIAVTRSLSEKYERIHK